MVALLGTKPKSFAVTLQMRYDLEEQRARLSIIERLWVVRSDLQLLKNRCKLLIYNKMQSSFSLMEHH